MGNGIIIENTIKILAPPRGIRPCGSVGPAGQNKLKAVL